MKKNYYEQITNVFFSFAVFPRGQREDLNFKNDWQKEKVNYGQRLLNLEKDNKFRQSEDRSHEG